MRQETGRDIYMNLDPSSLLFEGDDPVETVLSLKDIITGVHVKDCKYKGTRKEELYPWMLDLVRSHHFDQGGEYIFKGPRPEFTPMGAGDMDFKVFLEALKKINY